MEMKQEYEVKQVGRPTLYDERMRGINVRLPNELLHILSQHCRMYDVERSKVIRQALEEFFSPG